MSRGGRSALPRAARARKYTALRAAASKDGARIRRARTAMRGPIGVGGTRLDCWNAAGRMAQTGEARLGIIGSDDAADHACALSSEAEDPPAGRGGVAGGCAGDSSRG